VPYRGSSAINPYSGGQEAYWAASQIPATNSTSHTHLRDRPVPSPSGPQEPDAGSGDPAYTGLIG